jgi:hypothetical protein
MMSPAAERPDQEGKTMRKQSRTRPTFFMGVVLGAIVSVVTLFGTAAVAGTGVGGVFNLGRTNTVNAKTTLTGSHAGSQLQVINSSSGKGANGIGINVAKGKSPLTVNSSTKVSNLNADYVDGQHASAFQLPLKESCGAGTAIRSVMRNGDTTCTSSVVLPIALSPAAHVFALDLLTPSSLQLNFACSRPSTGVSFVNTNATDAATLNWMFSDGGITSTVDASGNTMAPGRALPFDLPGNRLEGQWIFAEPGSVTTVNLHGFNAGSGGCEFRGTAEVAATS